MSRVLRGARVLLDGELVDNPGIRIAEGRIVSVVAEARAGEQVVTLPPGAILAPGFIDVQANGGGGVLFNDAPTWESIRAMQAAHRPFGTTFLLPTLITDRPDRLRQAGQALRQALRHGAPAGLHIEGPFISPQRPGVHDPAHIRPIGPEDIALLCDLAALPGARVVLTLAPECCEASVIARLSAHGVIVCAGHTAATPAQVETALQHGLRGFTHLYNAMPPIAGRDPGPVPAALLDRESWCGLIADGVHVNPVLLRLAMAVKPMDRLFLVTDSMSPLGTDAPDFVLNGQRILRRGGRLETESGTLAGADLDMAAAVRYVIRRLGIDPAIALRMATAVPAAFLRLDDDRGRIAPGLRADLVLLSPDWAVLGSWLDGQWCASDTVSNS